MNQKITPFLWFEDNAEEAMGFYTSVFPNSQIDSIKRYPTDFQVGPVPGMGGKVLTGVFTIMGKRFMCLDGGPYFKFNPAISISLTCSSVEEAESYYTKLAVDGTIRMPFQEYPWSKRYGWFDDKFGVSWQINTEEKGGELIPTLMFVGPHFGKCEEAISFYTSVFKNSETKVIARYEEGEGPDVGKVKFSHFLLSGEPMRAMESSLDHKFEPSGAISFYVECEDQAEVDYFWSKLSANPQAEQCGWLQDKYGFSWQIVPKEMGELLSSTDKEKSKRALEAMLKMKKLDIAELKRAYEGNDTLE